MPHSKNHKEFQTQLAVGCAVVVIIWLAGPYWVQLGLRFSRFVGMEVANGEPINEGTFGDQYGAINALFSGLALAAIAISLWYQRRDIEIQQQALLDQKDVFERQLRLAATTEIVASLPRFVFQSENAYPSPVLSYKNTGEEVFDISISLRPNSTWAVGPHNHYFINIPQGGFNDGFALYKPAKSKEDEIRERDLVARDLVGRDVLDVQFMVNFTIRSGEAVKLIYLLKLNSGECILQSRLKDTIESIIQSKIGERTPQPNSIR
jgi:hypothetical protein